MDMSPQQMIAQVQEVMRDNLRRLAEKTKMGALEDAIAEHGKSVDALDSIMGVLVKHGCPPIDAAELAIRYWSKGWEERLKALLEEKYAVTPEEVEILKKEVTIDLGEMVLQMAKEPK